MAEVTSSQSSITSRVNLFSDTVFVEGLRKQMFGFAKLQLSDAHLAEDAVQDALAGAVKNEQSFANRSAAKTWIFGILKNKIIDIIRERGRLLQISFPESENDDAESVCFKKGHWQSTEKPSKWPEPDQAAENEQFWLIFDACLKALPPKHARPFMMSELLGLSSEEICKILQISTTNLHVSLYRARLGLRRCLENRWFQKDPKR